MKDIHVVMIGYCQERVLRRALASLTFIGHRVEGVTVIDELGHTLEETTLSAPVDNVKFLKLINESIRLTFQSLVRDLSCEYLFILNDGDVLCSKIQGKKLELSKEENIMTYFYKVKNKAVPIPFLMRTSFLKQTNILSTYQFPFKEAALPSLLINSQGVVHVEDDFISSINKRGDTNTLQKLNFIGKYPPVLRPKEEAPSIAVILANYNMAEYVGVAISSCFLQGNPPEQILVIDDGSTDHSLLELEKWSAFPQVKVFRKKNGGKARALNTLLPFIKTDFVLELDADDWLDPDALFMIRKGLLNLPSDVSVLYGNLRTWKQTSQNGLKFKGIRKGRPVRNQTELLSYHFPLGPRIYRTSSLIENQGFPILTFQDGRMFEDVSLLYDLVKKSRFLYKDFTVYNVREHELSITKRNRSDWNDYLEDLH